MAEVKKYHVAEPWLETSCSLGEGPYYDEESKVLRFLDIEKNEVHTIAMGIGAASHTVQHKLDYAIGCISNVAGSSNELVYGGASGIGFLNLQTGNYDYSARFWNEEERASGKEAYMRSNDGAVDPQGRFWVGCMCDPRKKNIGPEGALFRMGRDLKLHRELDGLAIPNGMSWTDDGKTMYFTDTASGGIDAYDWDGASGSISNKRVFWSAHGKYEGAPDGHTLDSEGHLWVALCGGSKVVRISPQGQVVAEVTLPTRLVTSTELVEGELIVTSAAEFEPTKYPDSAKHAGQVFKVHVGVNGQAATGCAYGTGTYPGTKRNRAWSNNAARLAAPMDPSGRTPGRLDKLWRDLGRAGESRCLDMALRLYRAAGPHMQGESARASSAGPCLAERACGKRSGGRGSLLGRRGGGGRLQPKRRGEQGTRSTAKARNADRNRNSGRVFVLRLLLVGSCQQAGRGVGDGQWGKWTQQEAHD
ncbi:hypothetical protein FH972_021169 [Carpinus fangiana]|uniref:SMP-30/Gluconolactonase/LRE-like region domain-containing protein n=1 Tax=Carpinus fangiana TaxID=176857 RepID=A0A5N6KNM2_9ROSI|nr:hypothetical protein FH972_021169 [Carpinus fangiana]